MYNPHRVLRQSVTVFILILSWTVLHVESKVAAQQTYTGQPRCELVTNHAGDKWAEMWCQGSYPTDTFNDCPPDHLVLNQRIPGGCGSGSYITEPVVCHPNPQNGSPGASFSYYCAATGIERIVTMVGITCTRTCNNGTLASQPLLEGSQCSAGSGCTQFTNVDSSCACESDPGNQTIFGESGGVDAPYEDWSNCFYMCPEDMICLNGRCSMSPVLIDLQGNGFALTGTSTGVQFDLNADGLRERVSWTALFSDDGFLALDRNGNGVVDDGQELFGSVTPQPDPPGGVLRNGFNALIPFDQPENGGNSDGVIDETDAIFTSLLLWQDTNHNGVSEADELRTLSVLGLESIDLDYKESKRVDEHGNHFRYRAKVDDAKGAKVNRWAWDVFLIH